MFLNSIRWRLQLWHGLILVGVLAGFGLTAFYLERANQWRKVDLELQQRAAALANAIRPPPGMFWSDTASSDRGGASRIRSFQPSANPALEGASVSPPDSRSVSRWPEALAGVDTNLFYFVVWLPDGRLQNRSANAPANVPLPAPQAADQLHQIRARDDFREFVHYTPHGRAFLVGRSVAVELSELWLTTCQLAGVGLGVLLLGLAGGWWLASRAIRPIETISGTATKIAAGDLSQRINLADTDSELGRLGGVLNSTFARLEAAFAQQARFTADAAHELRTPVSVILNQSQTALGRARSAAEYRENLEACQRAAQRMRRLIESLLELARLDAGQAGLRLEPFDLSAVVADCVDLMRPLADERQIKCEPALAEVRCQGDAERIKQVITNLLGNAICYNHVGGLVRISVRSSDGRAVLTVTDTGSGIAAEHLPHLFERFYRADKSRSRAIGGAGLGLAICQAIVAAHGGTIEVQSAVGEGTTLTVSLPAESVPGTPAQAQSSTSS
jgi:two-component system, OmpR family, sensor kinase